MTKIISEILNHLGRKKMNLLKFISLTPLLFVVNCSNKPTDKIIDLINPIILEQGTSKEFVISDIFYSENYNINFIQNDNFIIEVDDSSQKIIITPDENFSGLDLISFNLNGNTYELPVKLVKKNKYLFKFKPKYQPGLVNLFGQFNGWDRQNLPMEDLDGDGEYETTIPLDPGRYEYKFYVDGEELIDPLNSDFVPNGMGDFNSVIVIENKNTDKTFLHLLDYENYDDKYYYRFFYESLEKDLIKSKNVVALLDNFKIDKENILVDSNTVTLLLSKDEITGVKTLRVAISKSGKATDFKTISLEDGIPTSKNDFANWRDAIIYSIMVDRFYDGDSTNSIPVEHEKLLPQANYQGGDLQGIIDKIENGYFKSLGINTIWISPVIDNTNEAYEEYPPPHRYFTGYHGYWPTSATEVEEHFGDLNLLKEFVNTAHKNGIKVLLDYVSNHIHEEHPFWSEHRDWFGKLELPDGRKNLRLFDEQRLTTWFEPYMPSFDYENSTKALETMTDNAVWWLKVTGADGYRHDAVKHVPNEFWRMLTKKIKKEFNNKNIYQVGETFGSFDLISSYVNNGQLSSQFNFNLFDVALPVFLNQETSFELLDLQMQKSFTVYGVNHLMANIIDSHDKVRYMAYVDGDIELNSNEAKEIGWINPPEVNDVMSYKKLQLHLAYLLTIPGVPVIYYGDEFGMTGAADPDNRRMMRFDDELNESEKETLVEISKLIHLRRDHSSLRNGDFYTLIADENIYAYVRSNFEERILVVLNKNENKQSVNLSLPSNYKLSSATDLLTDNEIIITENNYEFEIDPIDYKFFILK